jgi:ketosteroid isomerase-like protein
MSLKAIADELVAGCRENRTRENLDKLYAPDAVSVEPSDMGGERDSVGLAAIHGKHDWWEANFDVLDLKVEGPFLHGDDRFAVIFEMETVNKVSSERGRAREVGIYHVKDGKIVREEFFY